MRDHLKTGLEPPFPPPLFFQLLNLVVLMWLSLDRGDRYAFLYAMQVMPHVHSATAISVDISGGINLSNVIIASSRFRPRSQFYLFMIHRLNAQTRRSKRGIETKVEQGLPGAKIRRNTMHRKNIIAVLPRRHDSPTLFQDLRAPYPKSAWRFQYVFVYTG